MIKKDKIAKRRAISENRRKALMWRVPLAAMVITVLFWSVWHLIAGSVPTATVLMLIPKGLLTSKEITIKFPFAIPRWTDIIFAPIWAFFLVAFLTDRRNVKTARSYKKTIAFIIFLGLTIGMCIWLITEIIGGLLSDEIFKTTIMMICIWLSMWIGMLSYWEEGWRTASIFEIGFWLGVGLIYGVFNWLGIGLVIWVLAVGILVPLTLGLSVAVNFIFSRLPYVKVAHGFKEGFNSVKHGLNIAGRWIIAADKQ
jgi:hypothetical protein